MKGLEDINLHNEEIKHILERPPSFLVKAGTLLICISFFILLLFSYFIRYPENINGELILQTDISLYPILAKENKELKQTNYVKKNDTILKNEILAIYDNKAHVGSVIELKKQLQQVCITDSSFQFPSGLISSKFILGEIEDSYIAFLNSIIEYKKQIKEDADHNKLLELTATYYELLAQINNWEKSNLIISPMEGIVVYSKEIKANPGDTLFIISPILNNHINCIIKLPLKYKNKIQPNQKVKITTETSSFNWKSCEGKVNRVFCSSYKEFFAIELDIPSDFLTPGSSKEIYLPVEVTIDNKSLFAIVLSYIEHLLKRT